MKAAALVAAALIAGCGSLSGEYPRSHPLVPDASLRLTENTSLSLEKIVTYAGLAGVAYLVLDPLAPNWRIEEARLDAEHYHLSLRMKRVAAGGDGEARALFQRRAGHIARAAGYPQFEILSYSEGIESLFPAQRVGEGVIRLIR